MTGRMTETWTADQVKVHVDALLANQQDEIDRRIATCRRELEATKMLLEQRLAANSELTQAQTQSVRELVLGSQREVSIAFAASEKAIEKAETATDKRFDAVNEFRAQLADQATTFMPRELTESQLGQLGERLRKLEDRGATQGGASIERRRAQEKLQPWMLALAVFVFSLVVALANYAAAH